MNDEPTTTALCSKCGEADECDGGLIAILVNRDECVWVHEDCLAEYEGDQQAHITEHGGEVLVKVDMSADEIRMLSEKAAKARLSPEAYVAKRLRDLGVLGEASH